MRDDDLGGPHHRPDSDASADLRIDVLVWRLRISIVLVGGAFVILDLPTAIIFTIGFSFCAAVIAAAHAIPRVQVRLARRRREARRA